MLDTLYNISIIMYMAKQIHPQKHKQIRPDIGEPFANMLIDLQGLVNSEPVNNWSYTVTCRRVILEAWRRAFPGKPVPKEALDMLKPYYKDIEL